MLNIQTSATPRPQANPPVLSTPEPAPGAGGFAALLQPLRNAAPAVRPANEAAVAAKLRDGQPAARPPAAASSNGAPARERTAAAPAPSAQPKPSDSERAREAARGETRTRSDPERSRTEASAPRDDASERDAAADDTTPAGAAAVPAPVDPVIAQWVARLQRGDAAADAAASDAQLAEGSAARKTRSIDAPAETAEDREASRHDAATEGAALETPFTELLPGTVGSDAAAALQRREGRATTALSGAGSATLAAISFASMPASAHAAAAPVAVALATPVHAPEFAQALGLQLSVLARDGIQHARLHLNPAEMGPVSVQIVMDGTQARIDFGADVAATRQAIEAGMDDLERALRDAGFTLAGGGVSQHSAGRGDGSADEPSARGQEARRALEVDPGEAALQVSAAARRIVAGAGVDLYA